MLEVTGWIGSLAFSFCGVPQAYQSYKQKSSEGINKYFLLLWFIGEILTIAYVLGRYGYEAPTPLMFNYVVNFLTLLVIGWYYLFPGESK